MQKRKLIHNYDDSGGGYCILRLKDPTFEDTKPTHFNCMICWDDDEDYKKPEDWPFVVLNGYGLKYPAKKNYMWDGEKRLIYEKKKTA